MQPLNERMKQARINKNISIKQVSKKLHTSVSIIEKWEEGTLEPNMIMINAYANAIDVSFDEIVTKEELNQYDYNQVNFHFNRTINISILIMIMSAIAYIWFLIGNMHTNFTTELGYTILKLKRIDTFPINIYMLFTFIPLLYGVIKSKQAKLNYKEVMIISISQAVLGLIKEIYLFENGFFRKNGVLLIDIVVMIGIVVLYIYIIRNVYLVKKGKQLFKSGKGIIVRQYALIILFGIGLFFDLIYFYATTLSNTSMLLSGIYFNLIGAMVLVISYLAIFQSNRQFVLNYQEKFKKEQENKMSKEIKKDD